MSSILATVGTFAAELVGAARRLSRVPGFSALVIASLTIGIGINTAMIALLDGLLFRPPAEVSDAERVVRIRFRIPDGSGFALAEWGSYPALADIASSDAFANVAGYTTNSVSVGRGSDATLANAMFVTSGFADVLGLQPHLGSLRLGADSHSEDGDRLFISFGFWKKQFGGDAQVVGRTITIDGRIYTVAGVAPAGFRSLSDQAVDLWLPLGGMPNDLGPTDWRHDRETFWLAFIGRLKPGITESIAADRASAVLANRRQALSSQKLPSAVVTSSIVPGRGEEKTLESKVGLWLAGVSALVLMIACANVANLVLARAMTRQREIFTRRALGATPANLARSALAEAAVLVAIGAMCAIFVGAGIRNAVASLLPGDVPLPTGIRDARSCLIAVFSATFAFIIACSVSLLHLRGLLSASTLLNGASNPRRLAGRTRRLLLGTQAALCVLLLFVAGLFAQSLRRAKALDLGIDLDRTIEAVINEGTSKSPDEMRALYERAYNELLKQPAVQSVAFAQGSPYMSGNGAAPRTSERTAAQLWTGRDEVAYRSAVGAGFFSTVGARSLRGRDFTADDRRGSDRVVIINAPLARHLWPTKDPIGECLWLDDVPDCLRVVGVLGGVWKFSALRRDREALYVPLAQASDATPTVLFIRTHGSARDFLERARAIVQGVGPDIGAGRLTLARDVVDPEFRPWQLGATVFVAFAIVALMLAAIGLYGVVEVSVATRLREIGIRMALGARPRHVIASVSNEVVIAVASGLLIGAALALLASKWLGGVLFETSPRDPAILAETAAVLLAISLVAVARPVIGALRADPCQSLREQ